MTKQDYVDAFNALCRGKSISFENNLLPMFSEYLTENNIENSEKIINLVVQNHQLINWYIPEVIDYYCRKHEILSLVEPEMNINKTILYYE